MKTLPTDLEILSTIYEHYEDTFIRDKAERRHLLFVPIDIEAMAQAIGIDPHVLYGRLHHDLNQRYGYVQDPKTGVKVTLFTELPDHQPKECINFPLLAGKVSSLQDQDKKQNLALLMAGIALVLSLGQIIAQLVG